MGERECSIFVRRTRNSKWTNIEHTDTSHKQTKKTKPTRRALAIEKIAKSQYISTRGRRCGDWCGMRHMCGQLSSQSQEKNGTNSLSAIECIACHTLARSLARSFAINVELFLCQNNNNYNNLFIAMRLIVSIRVCVCVRSQFPRIRCRRTCINCNVAGRESIAIIKLKHK